MSKGNPEPRLHYAHKEPAVPTGRMEGWGGGKEGGGNTLRLAGSYLPAPTIP